MTTRMLKMSIRYGMDFLRSSDVWGLCRFHGPVNGLDELSAKGETFQILRMPEISPNGVPLRLSGTDKASR